jgi:peptide/nickel transport system permease protein
MSTVVQPGDVDVSRHRSGRLSWSVVICMSIVGCVLAMVVLGSILAPQDPEAQDLADILASPSSAHWLGTDALGRDVLSRLIVGARSAFIGPLVIAVGSMLIGDLLGLVSGYFGGAIDSVLMRWVDFMWALPGMLVIIVVAGAFDGGYWLAVAMMVVFTAPFDARVIRGATLQQVSLSYVEAARTLGLSSGRIMIRHIWPNVAASGVANAFLKFAAAIVALSGLSYLGFGVNASSPDWGLMLSDGTSVLFENPVAALAPATMIVLTAMSMNIVGDWSYETLSGRGGRK